MDVRIFSNFVWYFGMVFLRPFRLSEEYFWKTHYSLGAIHKLHHLFWGPPRPPPTSLSSSIIFWLIPPYPLSGWCNLWTRYINGNKWSFWYGIEFIWFQISIVQPKFQIVSPVSSVNLRLNGLRQWKFEIC